jgi:hypothetical protein
MLLIDFDDYDTGAAVSAGASTSPSTAATSVNSSGAACI